MDPENLSTDLAGLLDRSPNEDDRKVLVIDFETDQGKGFGLFYGNTQEEQKELNNRRWFSAPNVADVTKVNPVTSPKNRGEFFKAFSNEAASDDKVRIFGDALIQFLNKHKEISTLELKAHHASAFVSYIAGQCQHLKQINCLSHYSAREQQEANDLLPSNAEEAGERKKRKAEEERREAEARSRKLDEEWSKAVPEPKGLEWCPKDCDKEIWEGLNSQVMFKRPAGDAYPDHSAPRHGLSIYYESIGNSDRYTAYAFKKGSIDEEKITIVTKTCLNWCKVNNVKKLKWYVDLKYQQQQQAFLDELKEDDNLETIFVSGEVDKAFRGRIQDQLKENLANKGKSVTPVKLQASPAQQSTPQQPKQAQVSETKPLNPAGEKSSRESKGQDETLPVLNLLSCILLGANVAMILEGDVWVKGVAFLATTGLSSVVALKASEDVREQPIIKYGPPALLSLTLVAQAAHLAR